MQSRPTSRVSRVSIAVSIFIVLLAMLVPACHLHPLLDKTAPEHCAICVSMHAALPMGVHVAPVEGRMQAFERVVVVGIQTVSSFTLRFAESRAPPPPAC